MHTGRNRGLVYQGQDLQFPGNREKERITTVITSQYHSLLLITTCMIYRYYTKVWIYPVGPHMTWSNATTSHSRFVQYIYRFCFKSGATDYVLFCSDLILYKSILNLSNGIFVQNLFFDLWEITWQYVSVSAHSTVYSPLGVLYETGFALGSPNLTG